MSESVFEAEQSVDAEVSPAFAWDWRTDVKNWDDPPATFQLEGAFAAGAWGTTLVPGQDPLRWQVRSVAAYRSFIIDMPLDRAALSFEWRFEPLSSRRTRLTQRVLLSGANAIAYAEQVRAGFGTTLRDGMERIARAMEAAEPDTPL